MYAKPRYVTQGIPIPCITSLTTENLQPGRIGCFPNELLKELDKADNLMRILTRDRLCLSGDMGSESQS